MHWNHPDKLVLASDSRILFVDVDGTLVSFNTHEPVPEALETLLKLREEGLKVCLATGRSYKSIESFRDLPFDAFVCSSGQNVLLNDGTVLRRQMLATSDVDRLCDYLLLREQQGEAPLDFTFIGLEESYFNHASRETLALFRELNFGTHEIRSPEYLRTREWLQLLFMGEASEDEGIMALLPNSQATRWHPGFIDIMPKTGGKGDGILAVCEHFGLPLSAAVAIGDGENDISMFRTAGLSIAMGNASPQTQAEADLVTEHVHDGGLVLGLREIGLV